jgi:glycosyltransferase involved in cell wall biosynthesis
MIEEFFDENWYLNTYPDVKNARVDALTHYKKFGIKEGRLPCALPVLRDIRELWALPHSIEKNALSHLQKHTEEHSPNGAYALANIATYLHSLGAFSEVIALLEKNSELFTLFPDLMAEQGVYVVALESLLRIGKGKRAQTRFAEWQYAFSPTETLIARSLFEQGSLKVKYLSQIYSSENLENVGVIDSKLKLFDRVQGSKARMFSIGKAFYLLKLQKVTVIVPTFNAMETINTAIRSLCAQSWKNLEIIVIDDHSSDETINQLNVLASVDNRIKVFRNESNRGAYYTRNRGLLLASGSFVTVMDADDWAHPQKIEKQVWPLIWNRRLSATVSHWARCNDALEFTRLRPQNGWVHRNVSSLMIRKDIAIQLGGWDVLRANADTEFYYRLMALEGGDSIKEIMLGIPLSFGRVTDTSLTRQSSTHLITQYGGPRKQYLDFARVWHRNAKNLKLKRDAESAAVPFPVPPVLLSNNDIKVQKSNEREFCRWQTALDENWYLLSNKDIDERGVGLYDHYWQSGESEDRAPSPLFLPSAYQYCYLQNALDVSPTWHALTHGWDFNQPVTLKGKSKKSGIHIVLVGHQVTSQLFGAEISLLDMLGALSDAGYRITLILPSARNTDYVKKCLDFVEAIKLIPLPWFRQTRDVSQIIITYLSDFYARNDVQAVYVNTLVMHEPLIAAKRNNVKSIVHVRELPENDPDLMQTLGETPAECRERLLSCCDFFIANSKLTASWLNAEERTLVVYNTVSEPAWLTEMELRQKINVCMVSSNIKKKGVSDFFEVARMCSTNKNLQFNLYGPVTQEVERVQKVFKTTNVKIHGYVSDINYAIQQNHIVLSLSWFKESFGRTVAEAMLNERVVVAYDWGAVRELVVSETGILVNYKDTAEVARTLDLLSSDPELLILMARRARKRASELFVRKIYNAKLRDSLEMFLKNL